MKNDLEKYIAKCKHNDLAQQLKLDESMIFNIENNPENIGILTL
ncbi:hypothetical protein WJM97_18685 [Okeanomitos corallinicola TIOX110]|uniref:XRE family transcriptional regulator n=1 Tax=Okeanomitos corallinicola TIOX110 TaxID=3133117 RepID=A0ABZ2UQX2_9CYAN